MPHNATIEEYAKEAHDAYAIVVIMAFCLLGIVIVLALQKFCAAKQPTRRHRRMRLRNAQGWNKESLKKLDDYNDDEDIESNMNWSGTETCGEDKAE